MKDDEASKITSSIVDKASIKYTSTEKLTTIRNNKFLKKVYEKLLNSNFFEKKFPTFLISFATQSDEINALVDSRLVHEIPTRVLIPGIAGQYRVYVLDHGIRVMNRIMLTTNKEFFINTFLVKTKKTNQIVRERIFKAEDFKVIFPKSTKEAECPLCDKKFSKNSKINT